MKIMKWFKHESNARHDVKMRILLQRHGVEGYGLYFLLLEMIAEYATEKNIADWGFVDRFHNVETLATECGVNSDKLRDFLKSCNELDLFQKKEHRLYCRQILTRLDDYAQRILRKNEAKSKQGKDNVRTESEQSTVRIDKNRIEQIRLEKNRTEQIRISGKSPETKNDTRNVNPRGVISIGEILKLGDASKHIGTAKGIYTEWQNKGFQYAKKLEIKLEGSLTGRWLKVFKQAANGRNSGNLEKAFSYLVDHPKKLMTSKEKANFFFKIYEKGLKNFENNPALSSESIERES